MDTAVANAFGAVLRSLRKDAGLTQEQLGLEADVQRKFVSSLELGEKQPTLTTVFKLATALNIKPGKLISLVDEHLKQQ